MTKIEWVKNQDGTQGKTWNPVTGCTKITPGCAHCFAERMAHRLAGRYGYPEAPNQFKVTLHPDKLFEPLTWKKPSMIFVDSMGDLFHKDVPLNWQTDIFEVMDRAYWHTFQVLTKRANLLLLRMGEIGAGVAYRQGRQKDPSFYWPPRNVWIGVSAETQATVNERIPLLLRTPVTSVRFVSVEPMLERIDLFREGNIPGRKMIADLDWVICGGETGLYARPSPILADVKYLKYQCEISGVPFFLKQMWGQKLPELDGRQWTQFPEDHHV